MSTLVVLIYTNMEQLKKEDIFETRINDLGKLYIRKFSILVRAVIFAGIFISLIHISSTIVRYLLLKPYNFQPGSHDWWDYKLYPYYTLVYCILLYSQLYFYWQTTKYLQRGLMFNDEQTFNKAFRSLFRYALLGLISVSLSILSYGSELYGYLKDYFK